MVKRPVFDKEKSTIKWENQFDVVKYTMNLSDPDGEGKNRQEKISTRSPENINFFFKKSFEFNHRSGAWLISSTDLMSMTKRINFTALSRSQIITDDEVSMEEILEKMKTFLESPESVNQRLLNPINGQTGDPQITVIAKSDFDRLQQRVKGAYIALA